VSELLSHLSTRNSSRMRYSERELYDDVVCALYEIKQDAQLSQRDRAAVCVIVFTKSRTLELGDNDLRTL